jgi:hypothetical protein
LVKLLIVRNSNDADLCINLFQYFRSNEATHPGRLRLAVKKHLSKEMEEIDDLVKKIVG